MKLLCALSTTGLAVAALTSGCLNEREYVDPQLNNGSAGGAVSNLAVRNGALRGDFGPRRGFDGTATEMKGQSDYEFKTSNVSVVREEDRNRGAGMVILWTSGTTLEALPLGRHNFEYDPNALEQDQVGAQVCSGAAAGDIDYDQPAQSGHVVVSQLPEGGRKVDVHTETPALDATGAPTSTIDVSDTTFHFAAGQQ